MRFQKSSWARLGTGDHGSPAHMELDSGPAQGVQSSGKGQSQTLEQSPRGSGHGPEAAGAGCVMVTHLQGRCDSLLALRECSWQLPGVLREIASAAAQPVPSSVIHGKPDFSVLRK